MLYAKCLQESQIAKNKQEFDLRLEEEYPVYCVGETTKSKGGMAILYCVPINFIYDCLKYGTYIAIIDFDDGGDYIQKSSYIGTQKTSKEQCVTKIMNAYSKEAIDFVFNEVKNPELVNDGYIENLPNELQEYFKRRKGY